MSIGMTLTMSTCSKPSGATSKVVSVTYRQHVKRGSAAYLASPRSGRELSLQREAIATVPLADPLAPSWMHDFAATEKHVLLTEWPVRRRGSTYVSTVTKSSLVHRTKTQKNRNGDPNGL